jgi:hypothetical protein
MRLPVEEYDDGLNPFGPASLTSLSANDQAHRLSTGKCGFDSRQGHQVLENTMTIGGEP